MNVVFKLPMGHQEGGIPEELKLWPSVPLQRPTVSVSRPGGRECRGDGVACAGLGGECPIGLQPQGGHMQEAHSLHSVVPRK